jgi:hypothetical protein
MSRRGVGPPLDQLPATAEAVARARPEVDLEMAREVFCEAATLLHDGLALDGLDGHDARAVVAGLCVDLVVEDPGAAVRARSRAAQEDPATCTIPKGCPRPSWLLPPSCSSDRGTWVGSGGPRASVTPR